MVLKTMREGKRKGERIEKSEEGKEWKKGKYYELGEKESRRGK